jgi:hypothetical protein
MFVNESEINEQFYRGPSKDACYQVSIHLAKHWLIFLNLLLWNRLVGSIYGMASINLLISSRSVNKHGRHRQFLVAMFVNGSGQNEQSLERTFHRCFLPSFTSFGWGVSEEKIKMWKVNRRRMPSDGKSSHCLWQGELKRGGVIL